MTTLDHGDRDFAEYDDFDIFGAFDSAAGHDLEIDPYPTFAELRQQGPILPVDLHDVLGISHDILVTAQSSGYADLPGPRYSAVSFEAVDAVLRDSRNFNQEIPRRAYQSTFGAAINTMDEPEHRLHRNLVEQAFTRRAMETWTEEIIAPLARRRAEDLRAKGPSADLVRDFIFFYPAEVITLLLGLPEEDVPKMMRMGVAGGNPADPEMARSGAKAMTEWIFDILEQRRSAPGGRDVLSLLTAAEIEGERLSGEEIASFIRLLYPAGFETTFRSLSNLMVGLLTSGQLDLVRSNRSLVPQAVEEGLRWQTPLLGHPRFAVRDVEVCGLPIPAGAVVHAYHASANRDETRWSDPDRFDVTRPTVPHSSFGFGPHLCIGKNLARVESVTAVNTFLDLFPDMHVSPDVREADYRIRGLFLRSPEKIPVTLF